MRILRGFLGAADAFVVGAIVEKESEGEGE